MPNPFLGHMARRSPSDGSIPLDPVKFYALADLIRTLDKTVSRDLDDLAVQLDEVCDKIDDQAEALAKANNAVLAEARRATKRRNPFETAEEHEDIFSDLRHTIDGDNFLRVIFDVVSGIQLGFRNMRDVTRGLRPEPMLLSRKHDMRELLEDLDFDHLQKVMLEVTMNDYAVNHFIGGVMGAEEAKANVIRLGRLLTQKLDHYYNMLNHRHSVDGIQIHVDPVTTDLAMSIFENVDANGEIQDGKDPDQLSAYSARKATLIADAIKSGLIGEFTRNPARLIEFITDHMKELWMVAEHVTTITKPVSEALRKVIGPALKKPKTMNDREFAEALEFLKDLDPQTITYREKTGLLTAEERFSLNFRNETLRNVAKRLSDKNATTDDLIQYILRRKAELRDYYRDENSFYVCRVGNGNPFLGSAPGELEVIPGTRPVVNLEEIIGSGFDDVKSFIGQVETSSKWHELFLATSPSRTADKSNVLLIGPQGCGKSEILRAVGGDKKSLGIFAVGSDFLTCWKGEAEKNPKRLFEAANKLQKESKKHVHILIDEIDTILNKDSGRESFGGTNLVTEFQNLMDGVVHYPNLSVWGATNNADRIPMPMIRRFSKVLIVGELEQADRVRLLKHFSAFMPVDDIDETDWNKLAARLEGATGDVLRKIVDYIWRSKMTWFIQNNQEQAEKLRTYLQGVQGQKFTLADFKDDQRTAFKVALAPFVRVQFKDLNDSINVHLENVAIHHEIETAKATYARAKAFLAQLKKNGAPATQTEATA